MPSVDLTAFFHSRMLNFRVSLAMDSILLRRLNIEVRRSSSTAILEKTVLTLAIRSEASS